MCMAVPEVRLASRSNQLDKPKQQQKASGDMCFYLCLHVKQFCLILEAAALSLHINQPIMI